MKSPAATLYRFRWWYRLCALLLAGLLLSGCGGQPATPPQPDPSLTPREVVQIQVEALQHNDEPQPDSGIRTAFRFASPANQEVTGPIERFIPLVKSPPYRALLNVRSVSYGQAELDGTRAALRVTVIGSDGLPTAYLFVLSRQDRPPYEDCWMTDSVVPIPLAEGDSV